MRVTYLREAQLEISESSDWYEARNPRAARDFLVALRHAVRAIQDAPLSFPRLGTGGTRRAVLSAFPYSVIYVKRDSDVLIIAVAHARRDPAYWRDRM